MNNVKQLKRDLGTRIGPGSGSNDDGDLKSSNFLISPAAVTAIL